MHMTRLAMLSEVISDRRLACGRMVGAASRISDESSDFVVVLLERMLLNRRWRTFCFGARAVSLGTAVTGPSSCLAVAVGADEGRAEHAGRCFICHSPIVDRSSR